MYQKVGEFEILSNHRTKNRKFLIQKSIVLNMKQFKQ